MSEPNGGLTHHIYPQKGDRQLRFFRDTASVEIRRTLGIAGGRAAIGAAVVVDVFRAFSAAAYAFAAGAESILLASEVEEAKDIAANIGGAVLMGEDAGARPDGFDFGNSPGEITQNPGLVGRAVVVHRSSAGTRAARAALDAHADPVYVASLVVASATAAAVATEPVVTIVESGTSGITPAEEDAVCAELITGRLAGRQVDLAGSSFRVASCRRADYLRRSSFAHPDDVDLCAQTDRFGFAMRAEREDGLVVVRRVQP